MARYAIVTRFNAGSDHRTLPERSRRVHDALVAIDPNLFDRWSGEYVLLGGSIHGIDIIDSDDDAEVRRIAAEIERFGECTTEVLSAVPWREFIERMQQHD